jgi:GH25 family lysozyme M1 (1,4-beta-N-acetylmuramidase)
MFTVKGKLVGSNGSAYAGHRVVALFDEAVSLPSGPDKPFLRQTQSGTETTDDGTFLLELPDEEKIQGSILYKALAPTGRILGQRSVESGDVGLFVEIAARAQQPPILTPGTDPFPGQQVKLKGYVIDGAGRREVANKQVVLWGKLAQPKTAAAHPIANVRTDSHGYFSASWPRDKFAEAFAIVSIGRAERVPIHLDDERFPRTVVLVVDMSAVAEEAKGKCDCLSPVPRAPDSEDLLNSPDAYSADLGGRCVDFTVPNRALEEFSFYTVVRTTEPSIKGLELSPVEVRKDEPPRKVPGGDDTGIVIAGGIGAELDAVGRSAEIIPLKSASGRMRLTAKHPVDWDDTPTFYQATTIAHGHILHFKQTWNADGYSLGDLLYSLPLAPCQKKQIAIVDWTRRDQAQRSELSEEKESLSALFDRARDVGEVVDSILKESMRGGSSASSSGVAAGFGAAGSMGGGGYSLGAVLGISGGSSSAEANAWQDSSKSLAANSLQTLRDKTMQAASAVRSQRTSVIKSVEQGEAVRVQTEVVANHNHCHAITMQYFEVLRHLRVSQKIVDVQECLFVPLLMSEFREDGAKALRWRTLLQSTLIDQSLAGGFDAMERLKSDESYPVARYADEPIEGLSGELRIRFELSRPPDINDLAKTEADWELGLGWGEFEPFLTFGVSWPAEILRAKFSGKLQADRDNIFQEKIAPEIARKMVDSLEFSYVGPGGAPITPIKTDPTLISKYQNDASLYVTLRFDDVGSKRVDVDRLEITSKEEMPSKNSRIIVESGSVWYRTAHLETHLFQNDRINDDLTKTDAVHISCPLRAEELRNPKLEDQLLKKRLISHLNQHIEYYHRAIWWNMDPERRYLLLDGFEAPNAEGRSVASVVENRLIGIVGNCLVMPVARGHKLDPTYQQKDPKKPVDLLNLYAPETPIPAIRISLPTRGVFAESVMGACNSCEEIEDHRFWKFEEHPCGDEPTPLQSPGAESRYVDPGDLSAKSFPTPMINIQNAPPAPDPTGMAAALRVLAAPGAFANVTGLDRTQQNAIAALQTAMQGAEYFGGTAAQLAASETAGRGGSRGGTAPTVGTIDKTMQTIDKAEGSGHLTKEQAGELKEGAIRRMAGLDGAPGEGDLRSVEEAQKSGAISEDQARDLTASILRKKAGVDDTQRLMDDPDVSRLIQAAAGDGRGVTLERSGETVDVTSLGGERSGITTSPSSSLWLRFETLGIDVSHHQGVIDWKKVDNWRFWEEWVDSSGSTKPRSVEFAWIKATEGALAPDSQFTANWAGVAKTTIIPGAYLKYRTDNDPVKQAEFFQKTVGSMPRGEGFLPPAVDFEENGIFESGPGKNKKKMADDLFSCLSRLSDLYHAIPFIYTNLNTWNNNIDLADSRFRFFPLWVSNFDNDDSMPRSLDPKRSNAKKFTMSKAAMPGQDMGILKVWKDWAMWQFRVVTPGEVDGIASTLDINAYNGNSASLFNLTR